jgi:hypothetical protein
MSTRSTIASATRFIRMARAAVAHQRQRQPLGGQHAQVHAHVDEGLAAHPHADALHHQAGEHAVERDGLAADEKMRRVSQKNSR